MTRFESKALVAALAAVAIVGGAWVWHRRESAPSTPASTAAPPPASAATVAAAPSAPAASEPLQPAAAQHPIAALVGAQPASPLAEADVGPALVDLMGRKAVLSFLTLDDFPRRVVATVDNLGRAAAPARLWPVHPTEGRFTTTPGPSGETISPDNDLRYTPFVLLAETVDLQQAVALYVRMYPLLQQAYEDLGYPKKHFNDRLIEVIDQLLATPEPTERLHVHLTRIEGPVQPARPWVLYEFDDPALQSLSSGQKLLLRMGPVNERRLKGRLVELRRRLTES